MWPYWLLFAFPAFMALRHVRERAPAPDRAGMRAWTSTWWFAFAWLSLMIGLREKVGGDWINYAEHLTNAAGSPFSNAFADKDLAYSLVNWIGAQTSYGMYIVNSVSAVLFAWGLIVFCRAQPRPWLALVVAVPYLVVVVAMGYTRQGVAIGLAMVGLVALGRGRAIEFGLWVIAAATWHKSAVILIPLALMAGGKSRFWTLLWVVLAGGVMFVLLVQESLDALTTNYLGAHYDSSGAAVRVAMNALPAAVFLVFRKRFELTERERTFWTWMAGAALVFVVLLKVSPSSTAVDRLALYWIPIQVFVWGRMPKALNMPGPANALGVVGVLLYSAAVLLVWLGFADNAFAWLPYGFYPSLLFWGE
jgi:hypothetical protein